MLLLGINIVCEGLINLFAIPITILACFTEKIAMTFLNILKIALSIQIGLCTDPPPFVYIEWI